MTPKAYWESHDPAQREAVAATAGTTLANFRHIALYNGSCSPALARRLVQASHGAMTLEGILFGETKAA